jgi:hypothetical protein
MVLFIGSTSRLDRFPGREGGRASRGATALHRCSQRPRSLHTSGVSGRHRRANHSTEVSVLAAPAGTFSWPRTLSGKRTQLPSDTRHSALHPHRPDLDDQLSENGKAAFGRESIECRLHRVREFLVAITDDDFVLSRLRSVARRPIDWLAQFHRDLRRKRPRRDPPWNDTKGRSEHERHHLDAERPVEAKTLCEAVSSRENDDRLVGAN